MQKPLESKLSAIRRQLMLGLTWHEAARRGDLPTSTAYKRAVQRWPELKGRRPRIPESRRLEIERAIRDLPLSRRAVARMYGVSPDTVCRFAKSMVDAECLGDGVRTLVNASRQYRCDVCGNLVCVRPCLICAARGKIGRMDGGQ